MKKLLLLLSLLSPITSLGASGGGKVDASYIEAVRQGSAPSAPASGKARAYVLDSDGKFYVKNSSNTAKACTYSGDIVNADLSGSAAITNANLATMAQSTFKCRTTASTGVPEDCTAAQAQAIVGSTPQLLTHQSTPSNPAAGSVKVYPKSDNNLYILDSGGTETVLALGGAVTQSYLRMTEGNGLGGSSSGETHIRNFLNTINSGGTDFTYTARTTTAGDKITINVAGVYSATYCDLGSSGSTIGFSVNSNQLSTSIATITSAHQLAWESNSVANQVHCVSWTGRLAANDVFRFHTANDVYASSGAQNCMMSFSRSR